MSYTTKVSVAITKRTGLKDVSSGFIARPQGIPPDASKAPIWRLTTKRTSSLENTRRIIKNLAYRGHTAPPFSLHHLLAAYLTLHALFAAPAVYHWRLVGTLK